jgi:hypothetical protein
VNPNEAENPNVEAVAQASSFAAPAAPIAPQAKDPWASRLHSAFVRHLLVIGVLGAMVMVGLFLANYSSDKALYYWCAMFPLFGIASIAHEVTHARTDGGPLWKILLRQVLHWIGPVIAVKILFMQHARGQMSTDAVALTTVLVLAVTCFLAGVNFESSFLWISALLVMAALIGTEIETYLWLVILLFVIGITLAVTAVILQRRARAAAASTSPPIS